MAEKEYIDRQAFIKRLESEADRSTGILDLMVLNGLANIVRDKNIAPDADVVEVVRCGRCEYWHHSGYCKRLGQNHDRGKKDFCSYGIKARTW